MAGKLTRESLREAFTHMGELLARRKVVGEIAVFGGSATMLQMDMERALEVHARFFPDKGLHPDLKAALRGIMASVDKERDHADRAAPKHP